MPGHYSILLWFCADESPFNILALFWIHKISFSQERVKSFGRDRGGLSEVGTSGKRKTGIVFFFFLIFATSWHFF